MKLLLLQEVWILRTQSLKRSGTLVTSVPKFANVDRREHVRIWRREWLARIIRSYGPSARAIWLMHEPPAGTPLSVTAGPLAGHRVWTEAIERFFPWLVICGHDHFTPLKRGKWNCRRGQTLCVNTGQPSTDSLHYSVIEIKLSPLVRCLPSEMKITAYPWNEAVYLPGL